MKLIQQIKLCYKEGSSDKVYEIDLCEVGQDLYVVNFRYGRRGKTLKTGSKTPHSVNLTEAKAIFETLAHGKKLKGYKPENQSNNKTKFAKPATMEGVLWQRLQDAINGTESFKTKWAISRVVWKVGEVRFRDAVPYLIQLLDGADEILRYSIIWALVRCGDKKALETFQKYAFDKGTERHIRKVSLEGLLIVSPEEEKQKLITDLINKLPETIKISLLNNEQENLKNLLSIRTREKQKKYDFLETLYFLTPKYPFLNKILAQILSKIPLRPPHFRHIRAIYKLAELRDDALILGTLAYRFEKTPELYSRGNYGEYAYVHELNQGFYILDEVKKENSKIAFSNRTKAYLQRHSLRVINKLGKNNPMEFVKMATSILLAYSEKDYKPAYTNGSYGRWDRQNRVYHHHFTIYPACADSALLGMILYSNDKNLKINDLKWQKRQKITKTSDSWYMSTPDLPASMQKTPLERIRNWNSEEPQEKRTELHPEIWDKKPEAYIQLLMQGKMNLVHEFAYKNFKNHPDYSKLLARFDKEMFKKLLESKYEIPAFFGVELIQNRLQEELDKDLITILIHSKVLEGRNLGQKSIMENITEFTDDTNLIFSLLFSEYQEIRYWLKEEFLNKAILTENQLQILVGKSISKMLSGEIVTPELRLSVQNILTTHAKPVLKKISWDVILQLLNSQITENQIFASGLMVLKLEKMQATEVPFSILQEFFKSESEAIRADGMTIFAKYPESKLLEANELLGNMLLSPYQNLRDSSVDIIKNLVSKSEEFAQYITDLLLTALRRKETFEDAHKFIKNLLLNELKTFIPEISLQITLKFLHGNYREGQLLGLYLLSNHTDISKITLRQVVAIANHEVVEVRFWTLEFYQKNIARIKYEREESIRILDAKWEDIRAESNAIL